MAALQRLCVSTSPFINNMKRSFLFAVLLLAVLAAGRAQCPDFTDLTGPGVACWADNDVIGSSHGPSPGRYAVITQPGMDPYTGYQLPMLPPGDSAVVRIGNDQGGHQHEGIDYTFVVDPDHPVVTIKFAFVLQNFGNISTQEGSFPSFSISILHPLYENDYFAESIGICGYFNDALYGGYTVTGNVMWRPWATMTVDLSGYAGQLIRLRFITHDGLNGNPSSFSYAYFTFSCMSDRLSVVGCDGQHVTLAAPDGYANYLWNNGSTTSTSTYSLQDNLDVSCRVSSDFGCGYTFHLSSVEGLSMSNGGMWYDTVCQGNSYNGHGFDLPPQPTPGVFTFSRAVLDSTDCLSATIYKLHLFVKQRNVYYYGTACEGADFDQYGFHYTNLQAGTIVDSLPLTNDNGCVPAYKYLRLTVTPSYANSGELFGDTYVCDKTANTYTLNFPGPIFQYQWNVPVGVTNFTDIPGQSALLYFTEEAPNPAIISVTGSSPCGSHTLTKTVYHTPSYHLVYEDTACTGESYDGHGIQTSVLDNPGLYYISHNGTTVDGCDSNVMVRLWVGATPELSTLAQPTEICVGDSTTVHALGEGASFQIVLALEAEVKPGDILCTDNSIVKSTDWPAPDKTAKGVVFYVDSSGLHGWAVALQDLPSYESNNTIRWSYNGVMMGTVSYETIRSAMSDQNGYAITQLLSQYNLQYPHLYLNQATTIFLTDDESAAGWYLPTIRQLYILFCEKGPVNSSLQTTGSILWSYEGLTSKYWSSTERSNKAWCMNYSGTASTALKTFTDAHARFVCDF